MSPTPTTRQRPPSRLVARAIRRLSITQSPSTLVRMTLRGFAEHDLLTYASAIAFQVITALIPFALFAVALLGFLELSELWSRDLAPELQRQVSQPVYDVVNGVVTNALTEQRLFWLTLGLALTIWEISGAVRALMGALSAIYGGGDERSRLRRYVTSFALAIAVGGCWLLALAAVRFAPGIVGLNGGAGLTGLASFVVRWGAALALLTTSVWLLLRFAAAEPDSPAWASFGTGLSVTIWVLASLCFALYVRDIADYATIFGSLAAVFVFFTYIYISAGALLAGAQVDALIRQRHTGSTAGD